jgi:hypothetical protein
LFSIAVKHYRCRCWASSRATQQLLRGRLSLLLVAGSMPRAHHWSFNHGEQHPLSRQHCPLLLLLLLLLLLSDR